MKKTQIISTIKRNFIDNYKKSFDIYGAINGIIKNYFNEINHQLTLLYTINPNDQIFFDGFIQSTLHEKRYDKLCDRKELDKLDNDNLVTIFTKHTGEYDYHCEINYLYKRDFMLSLLSNIDNLKVLNFNAKNFSYRFYDMIIVKMLPYIYENITRKILSKLDLNPNEFTVTFTKVFDNNKKTKYEESRIGTGCYEHPYEPFISFSINNIYHYLTNDIKIPITYRNAIAFPFQNKIILANNLDTWNRVNLDDYDYNHLPTNQNFPYESLNNIFTPGYYIKNICIGNLCNNLHINIIHKDTNETAIIAYNDIGINPKFIHNVMSINAISTHMRKNLEGVINHKDYITFTKLNQDLDNLLIQVPLEREQNVKKFEKKYFMSMMAFLKEQYETESLYKSHKVNNKVVADNNQLLPRIAFKLNVYFGNIHAPYNITRFRNGRYEYAHAHTDIDLKIFVNVHNMVNLNYYFNEDNWDDIYKNISGMGYYHHPIKFYNAQELEKIFSESGYLVRTIDIPTAHVLKDYKTNDYPITYNDVDHSNASIESIYMTNAYILIRDYLCKHFIDFCKENISLINDPNTLEIIKEVIELREAINKLRNQFKQQKLDHFNNMPTLGNNINSTDITLEANYYNSNIQLLATSFYAFNKEE